MTPQKHTMIVLVQIARLIPTKLRKTLSLMHKIQASYNSTDSHVVVMLYAHRPHTMSLNDICKNLHNHAGPRF